MTDALILTWPGGGNQTPEIGLAQQLRAAGYDVCVAGYPDQRDRFAILGFPFTPLPGASAGWNPASATNLMEHLRDWVWACPDHVADVEAILAQRAPRLVIVDCLMGGALAAWDRHRVAVASIPELDPSPEQVPATFGWIGPVFEAAAPELAELADLFGTDERARVLVSFSTGNVWDQTSRIQRTLDGLAATDTNVVVTSGTVTPARLTVPDNAKVVPYLPHEAVLGHVHAVVTHAGHGTLAAALAHGLPVVALPNPAADQPVLAQRLTAIGAGIGLDGECAQPWEISAAVLTVLTDHKYRAAATAISERIQRYHAEPVAAMAGPS